MKNKFYITTPIYYANGKPHIGHAFATLYADVIARFQKNKGCKVLFITGTDEHGSKIAEAAQRAYKDPQNFVDEIASLYINTWKLLGIHYDDFIRTTSERHKKGVYEFMKRLFEAGDIYPDFYEGLYCTGCENFITEKNLVNGLCPDHLKIPQKIKEKNYFFNLKRYLPIIKEKILNKELKITPESRKNEILRIIEEGIPNFSVSREKVKWGIPFPYEKEQTVYVWVEALMNYVTALDFPEGEKFKTFWPADVHIIGAEINKFHSIFWLALLLSIKAALPKNIFVHGLFTVNGKKMSKTMGNIINPTDLVTKFGTDTTRYLLLSQFPASEHGDVKESEFVSKYNTDLADGIGNLFERVLRMIINYQDGAVKKQLAVDKKIAVLSQKTEENYIEYMESYQLFFALKEIISFAKNLDQYISNEEPWRLYKEQDKKLDQVLASLFFGIEKIMYWLEPFIPSKIQTVKKYIISMEKGLLKGEPIGLKLFPKIRDSHAIKS